MNVTEHQSRRTGRNVSPMSALPPKADIAECDGDVRFVPEADIVACPPHVGLLLKSRHSLERWHTGLTLKAAVYERGSKSDSTALARMPVTPR